VLIVTGSKSRAGQILTVSLLLILWCVAAPAQQKDSQQSGSSAAQSQPTAAKAPDAADKSAAPKSPAEARQAQLQADTQRLYQLTQELKEEVAKSNKDTLSVTVIKKAEEVEKLARSLKERMRQPQ
jgi:hypothetical protein